MVQIITTIAYINRNLIAIMTVMIWSNAFCFDGSEERPRDDLLGTDSGVDVHGRCSASAVEGFGVWGGCKM